MLVGCLRAAGIGLELSKARLNALVVLTTGLGFLMAAWPNIDGRLLLVTLAATALMAGGAAAMNQLIERDADGRMVRTAARPLPSGRVRPETVVVFGSTLGLVGGAWLLVAVNATTAVLGVLTFLLYVAVYTPLKRITVWNTVVGAIPGAIPPVMGWAATGTELRVEPWLLFLTLFCWQMPHFYALAWLYRDDYERAGFQMLVCHDPAGAIVGRQCALFAAALVGASVCLIAAVANWRVTLNAAVCGAVVFLLGVWFFGRVVSFQKNRSRTSARRLFLASIVYLPLVSLVLFAATVTR